MSNEIELRAGLRERIRDAIAADELVSVHAASDIKDQYCHVTELALDHIADIAAQVEGGVDGVAAVKEAWAALQVAVLDGRGWADKIVPMQKAIDALTPARGSDTQRLDNLQEQTTEGCPIHLIKSNTTEEWWVNMPGRYATDFYDTLREAIDAAMLKGGRDDG